MPAASWSRHAGDATGVAATAWGHRDPGSRSSRRSRNTPVDGEKDMNVGPGKWSTVGAVLLSAAALLSAAPASADETDDLFIAALAKNGITVSDQSTAVSMAHTVCTGLENSQEGSVLVLKVLHDTNLSPRQAGYFVGVSVAAYCPQYKGTIDTSLTWLLPFPPVM